MEMTRREFLQTSGAIVVTFCWGGAIGSAHAQAAKTNAKDAVDGFLAIGRDGRVTVYTGKVDLGTGTRTALAQMAADELDVALDQITMVMGDTALTPDQGLTGGSLTIMIGGQELRRACATARRALVAEAAKRLGVAPEACAVDNGVVTGGGRSIGYGEIAISGGFELKVDDKIALKKPADWKYVGKSVQRVEIPAKVSARFEYVQDVRRPGMVHARVIRSTIPEAELRGFDDRAAKRVAGYLDTVRKGDFLAVLARDEWAAIKAARAIRAEWSPRRVLPDAANVFATWQSTKPSKIDTNQNIGDADSALAAAPRKLTARYEFGIQTHASLGPSCAVAEVKDARLTVWSASQATHSMQDELASVTGLQKENIRLIYVEGSGCYGRNGHEDATADAALIATLTGRAVRVQWMRQDETALAPKCPPTLALFEAGLDDKGEPLAWKSEFYIAEHFGPIQQFPLLAAAEQGMKKTTNFVGLHFQNSPVPYKLPAVRVRTHQIRDMIFRSSHLRTPGRLENNFCNECFVDELAAAAGADPLAWRRSRLDDPRALAVIDATAKVANWEARPAAQRKTNERIARGQGFAYVRYNDRHTYVAAIAQVAVDRQTGEIAVERVSIGHDCGQMINPDGVANQIEGGVIQTVSRVLMEEVTFDAREVKSVDWASYPILRFGQVPKVELALIDRPNEAPWGVGEPAPVVVPAAIGNAVFDATGMRLRRVPFTPERVLAALRT